MKRCPRCSIAVIDGRTRCKCGHEFDGTEFRIPREFEVVDSRSRPSGDVPRPGQPTYPYFHLLFVGAAIGCMLLGLLFSPSPLAILPSLGWMTSTLAVFIGSLYLCLQYRESKPHRVALWIGLGYLLLTALVVVISGMASGR